MRKTIAQLFSDYKGNYQPSEFDWGKPVGNEVIDFNLTDIDIILFKNSKNKIEAHKKPDNIIEYKKENKLCRNWISQSDMRNIISQLIEKHFTLIEIETFPVIPKIIVEKSFQNNRVDKLFDYLVKEEVDIVKCTFLFEKVVFTINQKSEISIKKVLDKF